MLLSEEVKKPQILKDNLNFINKLKNMKLHLIELLNKKIRIELEIKNLKKTIDKRQIDYNKSLKVKLSLENCDFLDQDPNFLVLMRENPILYDSISELDSLEKEINRIKENYYLEKTSNTIFL